MANGAAADVVLADLVDLQRRHARVRRHPALERVLQRERVDDGGEHAHVIAGDAIHAGLGQARAAKDVAAADHDAELDAEPDDLGDLGGDAADDGGVDAVVLAAEQRFAAELQENPPIEPACAMPAMQPLAQKESRECAGH